MENRKDLVNIPYNGKDQWWLLSIQTNGVSISQCMTPTRLDSYKFFDYMNSLDEMKSGVTMFAEPLINVDGPMNSMENYRGSKSDPDPFMYRKKEIPQIKAQICHAWSNENKKVPVILWRSYFSTYTGLTDGMKSFLSLHFGGLVKFYTEETMQYLKDQAIKSAVLGMGTQLDELAKDIEVFHEKIDKYWFSKNML